MENVAKETVLTNILDFGIKSKYRFRRIILLWLTHSSCELDWIMMDNPTKRKNNDFILVGESVDLAKMEYSTEEADCFGGTNGI